MKGIIQNEIERPVFLWSSCILLCFVLCFLGVDRKNVDSETQTDKMANQNLKTVKWEYKVP